jgi:hypothetical protein
VLACGGKAAAFARADLLRPALQVLEKRRGFHHFTLRKWATLIEISRNHTHGVHPEGSERLQ